MENVTSTRTNSPFTVEIEDEQPPPPSVVSTSSSKEAGGWRAIKYIIGTSHVPTNLAIFIKHNIPCLRVVDFSSSLLCIPISM